MNRHRVAWIVGGVVIAIVAGLVIRNQVKVPRGRQAPPIEVHVRQQLFDLLQPVALGNCELERFGEAHDGGYLMCANLLGEIESAYSYGISGYDKWGCDIATRTGVRLHQYDCFDPTRPACPTADTIFHDECVAEAPKTEEGRFFDTIRSQIEKNGDRGKHIVLKIDVEGAEWMSFWATPDDVLGQIDQMSVEFHWVHDKFYTYVIERLKQFFHIAHIHFNNASCAPGFEPFPTWAYEVLFVNKRIGVVDASRTWSGLHALDAPNIPLSADCQPGPK